MKYVVLAAAVFLLSGCAAREPLSMALPREELFIPIARKMVDQLPGLVEEASQAPTQRVQVLLFVPLDEHGRYGSIAYRDGETLRTGKIQDRGWLGYGMYDLAERPYDPNEWKALHAINWPELMAHKGDIEFGAPDGLRVLVQYWDGNQYYEFMVNQPYFDKKPYHDLASAAIDAAFEVITPESPPRKGFVHAGESAHELE